MDRMWAPSEVSSLDEEAKEDAIMKEQIERRETERAVLAPVMKKKADAEAKKLDLMEKLAQAEQAGEEEDRKLASAATFLSLGDVEENRREELRMVLKNINAMDMFVEEFKTRVQALSVVSSIGAGEALKLSELHYRSVGSVVAILAESNMEGFPSIEEIEVNAIERLKEQDPGYFDQPAVRL